MTPLTLHFTSSTSALLSGAPGPGEQRGLNPKQPPGREHGANVELTADGAKIILNNNSQQISFAASPSLSSSPDYVWSDDGSVNQALRTDGSGNLSWADVNALAGTHELLSITHDDAIGASITTGDIIFSNATPKLDYLGIGASNEILRVSGGLPD
ncbi:hypothetical protein LCGC14_3151850, partial [marine sediment metagenome]